MGLSAFSPTIVDCKARIKRLTLKYKLFSGEHISRFHRQCLEEIPTLQQGTYYLSTDLWGASFLMIEDQIT